MGAERRPGGGAVIALWLAILYPRRVRAVVTDSVTECFTAAMFDRNVAAERASRTPGQVAFWQHAHGPDWEAVIEADTDMLRRLAEIGGGQMWAVQDRDAAAVFARDQTAARTYVHLWPWLFAAAAGLFPLDVGLRRVALDRLAARTRVREVGSRWRARLLGGRRRPRQQEEARPDTEAARLLAAKRRARQQREEQERDGGE